MKVTTLTIQNIGLIAGECIMLNKPLILFYGEIQQGKTTILNAVRYVLGGAFPADLLRHGAESGFIQLDFENGYVRREFYRGENGEVKSRPVTFVRDGVRVARPVAELQKFLNPFLLDQEHLARMTELERKKFFSTLFNTDTTALDEEASKCEQEARELRAKVKGYGDIKPEAVERVNVEELRACRASILEAHQGSVKSVAATNAGRSEHNRQISEATESLDAWVTEVERLTIALKDAKNEVDRAQLFLKHNQPLDILVTPPAPDTSKLDEQISTAAANNVRADQYDKDKKRLEQKLADEKQVLALERRLRAIRDEKIGRLEELSSSCGVPGLKFLGMGDFTFEGTTPGMLSTSQLMKLSSALSALYPAGLGVDLIDRGESLGKSIFELVERAQKEDKTILATVVGERPATVPERVGVFVVSNGKVTL